MISESERHSADRRIEEADAAIGRQHAVVARLRIMRRDTKAAEELLSVLVSTRAAFVRYPDSLS
jgi:hypothetical protein